MPEREWARLYSEGKSPEEAARHAEETYSYSTPVMGKRRRSGERKVRRPAVEATGRRDRPSRQGLGPMWGPPVGHGRTAFLDEVFKGAADRQCNPINSSQHHKN